MRAFRLHKLALAGTTLTLGLSLYAATATAGNTFLLQLGEHKTSQEARNLWENLQSAYPEALSGMQFRLGEVNEGGQTLYRTQVSGPDSRSEAQDICVELSKSGVKCLVVETSMYQPEAAPAQEFQVSEAPETTATKREGMADLNLLPADDEPSLQPVEEFVSEDMADVSIEVPEEEMMEMAAPAMEAPAAMAAEVAEPVSTPITKKRSFAQELLPWLRDDDDVEEVAEVEPEPMPVEPVAAAPIPAPAAPAPKPVAAPQVAPSNETVAQYEPEVTPSEDIDRSFLSRISDGFDEMVSGDDEKTQEQILAERAPKNLNAPKEVPVPPSVQPEVEMAAEAAAMEGEVEVAEAVRVPLSFGSGVPVPSSKPVGYGGFPSQPTRASTLWVQVSYFNSKEAAMGYWREISYQYPEETRLLRVRIVSPWKTAPGRAAKSSLRLGPLASGDAVNQICGYAAKNNLRCSTVNEVGSPSVSVRNGQPRTRVVPGRARHERKAVTQRSYGARAGGRSMYWLQLGAFGSVAEAQDRWNQLRNVHGDLLGRMQPQISYPTLSSATQTIFHLRTGPFVAAPAANATCNQLKARRLGCVVVQSR